MALSQERAKREIATIAEKHRQELMTSENFRRSLTLNIKGWADPAHALLEILQNADDAQPAKGQKNVSVEFDFREDGLLVRHNGNAFSPDDVRGISSIGDSTKSAEKHIGFMGIGFKSVYKFAGAAYVRSGPYSFAFHPDNYPDDPYAWVLVPKWCDDFPIEDRRWTGETTLFMPYGPKVSDNIRKQILSSPKGIPAACLLFLRHVSEIRMLSPEGDIRTISRKNKDIEDNFGGVVSTRRFMIFEKIFDVPSACRKEQAVIDSHRDGVKQRKVTLVFEAGTEDSLKPIETTASFFAFLPTGEQPALPFIVQADFILDAQRSRIDRGLRWNSWLLERAADVVMDVAVPSFKKTRHLRHRFLEVLPSTDLAEEEVDGQFVIQNMLSPLSRISRVPALPLQSACRWRLWSRAGSCLRGRWIRA